MYEKTKSVGSSFETLPFPISACSTERAKARRFLKLGLITSIIFLLLCLCTVPASAEDDFNFDFVTGVFEVEDFSAPSANDESVMETMLMSVDTGLPSKFDLRNVDGKNYVTSVKNQSEWGNCWAFAEIASAESSAIMKYGDTGVDLSEWHIVYFFYNRENVTTGNVRPELSGLKGDDIQRLRDGPYYDSSGNPLTLNNYLAKGIGLVDDSVAPYPYPSPVDIDPSKAMLSDSYYVVNSHVVNKTDVNDIKSMLMKNGCGVISYYSDMSNFFGDNDTRAWAYFQNNVISDDANHIVTLVGWDDDYDMSNFIRLGGEGEYPSEKGAWLIRNSWGDEEFGNDGLGNRGYFWLSYEDTSIYDIVFLEVEKITEPMNIYQYDGSDGLDYAIFNQPVFIKNCFTAKSDETINAVSFAALNEDVSYEAAINVNGVAVGTKEKGTVKYTGYHTISLTSPVDINEGDTFEVVLRLEIGSEDLMIPIDTTYYTDRYKYISASEAGQGYYSTDGGNTWNDAHTLTSAYDDEDIKYKGETTNQLNLRIKAITSNRAPEESSVETGFGKYINYMKEALTTEYMHPLEQARHFHLLECR